MPVFFFSASASSKSRSRIKIIHIRQAGVQVNAYFLHLLRIKAGYSLRIDRNRHKLHFFLHRQYKYTIPHQKTQIYANLWHMRLLSDSLLYTYSRIKSDFFHISGRHRSGLSFFIFSIIRFFHCKQFSLPHYQIFL